MEKTDYSINAGEVLKALIKENYLSQEEFSYEFGTDLRTISRYVNQGINKISVLQELSEFFDVSIEEFFRTKNGI